MDNGWIKLHRSILEKPIWFSSTLEQKVILITLLLLANHKENEWLWEGELFTCQPGQFITSLDTIASKSGVGQQSVRSAIKKFQKLKFLTNKSTKTGRLITIVKWHQYQDDDTLPNKQTNRQLTKTQQRPNKDLTTNKNDKNVRIKEKIYKKEKFEIFWNLYPRKIGKAKAEISYYKFLKLHDQIIQGLNSYLNLWKEKGTELQFIPHPTTWLNQQRWNDDVSKPKSLNSTRKPDLPLDWKPTPPKPINPEVLQEARNKLQALKRSNLLKTL